MNEPVLKVEDRGAVRIFRINRPGKLNALNFELTEALVGAFEAVGDDQDVRAVVLTGEGRAFCAGADRSEFDRLTPDNQTLVESRAELTTRLHAIIPACRVPVIAAVNGFALGGGGGLALACDYVIVSEAVKLGFPELTHGVVAAIVMAALVRDVGRKAAFDLVATGRHVQAEEAVRLGLANAVATPDMLLPEALRVAELLAGYEPLAVAETKRLLHTVADLSLSDGLSEGRMSNARMRAFRARSTA